jgi:hypothetical protein
MADPLYEGEPVTFESTITGDIATNYKFRWDVTGDGLWDGPGAGPSGWGDWGETDYAHTFCDNNVGEATVQAWDGTYASYTFTGAMWDGYDMTMNVGYIYYYSVGNQFTVGDQDITVDKLGGYKAYMWWYYPYPHVPLYYNSIRLWTNGGSLLANSGPLYPAPDSWAWADVPDVTLYAGQTYVISMHGQQQSTGYPYRYCHPGTYFDDVPDNDMFEWDGFRYRYGANQFPSYGPYNWYAMFCDIDFYWEETHENVIEDTASMWVDNVAPTVIDPQATVTVGQEGSAIEAVGWLDDPGTCDDWWYRWVWGDGTMTDWFKVNKMLGGARVLFIHAYLVSYMQPIIDDMLVELGDFVTQWDVHDYGPVGTNQVPSLSTMLQYDVIMTGNDYYVYGNADILGDRLADYMDAGGAVVALTFANGLPPGGGIGGRWMEDEYNPVERSYNYFTWKSLGTIYPVPSAPIIFNGVSALRAYFGHYSTSLTSGSTRIADWSNGHILCAEKTNPIVPNGAISLYYNFCPYNGYVDDDYARFMANCIKYASQMPDPVPKSMPIMTDPIGHIYADDHPQHVTPQDVFQATLEVKDDDHGRTIVLGAPIQLHMQDWEDATHSNDWTKGWYEAGDMAWYLHYPYRLDGSWCAFRTYYPYGVSELYSPVFDFTGQGGAIIEWDNYWEANWPSGSQDGYVQVSTDGGSTWDTLQEFHHLDPSSEVAHYQAMWGLAADQPSVQFRFLIDMYDDWYWEVDNIEIGAAQSYTMEGLGSDYCEITIENVFPGALVPEAFEPVVDERVTIDFAGFELTDPALYIPTEYFWYRWDYGDGTPVGPWIYKGSMAIEPINVLILHSLLSGGVGFVNNLQGIMGPDVTIDEYDCYSSVPSLSDLLPYDVIAIASNYIPRAAVGNVLDDYCAQGGGVVELVAMWHYTFGIAGQWQSQGYSCFDQNGAAVGSNGVDIYMPNHPIIRGAYGEVETWGCSLHLGSTDVKDAGVNVVADYAGGTYVAAAYRDYDNVVPGSGRIAGLNIFPLAGYQSGDAFLAIANALFWASGRYLPTPILDTVSHDYGDNGIYMAGLQIIDDDMLWDWAAGDPQPTFVGTGDPNDWISFVYFPVEVLNVDPALSGIRAEVNLDLVIRTTGEPNNDCTMTLWKGTTALDSVTVYHDGNYKMESMPATLDIGTINDYSITVEYENADPDGANPTWVFEGRFPSGHCKELKNVFKEDGTIWTIGPDLLKPMLLGEDIIFSVVGADDGSDDLVFDWQFGDGGEGIHVYANYDFSMAVGTSVAPENMPDAHPDRDPWFDRPDNTIRSPEMNPIRIGDEISYAYDEAGYYYVSLILLDDDACDGYPSYQTFMNGGGYDMEFYTVDLS